MGAAAGAVKRARHPIEEVAGVIPGENGSLPGGIGAQGRSAPRTPMPLTDSSSSRRKAIVTVAPEPEFARAVAR